MGGAGPSGSGDGSAGAGATARQRQRQRQRGDREAIPPLRSPRVPSRIIIDGALSPFVNNAAARFGEKLASALMAVDMSDETPRRWIEYMFDEEAQHCVEICLEPTRAGWKLVVQG